MSTNASDASTSPHRAAPHPGAAGFLYGVVSVALFSGFTLVSRAGLTASLQPWDLAALRFGIGGLLLLPALVRHGFGKVAPRDALALAFTGGLGFAACAYVGFALAPAAHGAVLLHGTVPLTTYLIARAQGTPTTRARLAGLGVIALGVAAMAAAGALRNTASEWVGDGALLLASFSWSAYGLLVQRAGLRPAQSAAIVAVLSMCTALPALWLIPSVHFSTAPWHEWLFQAVFQGLLIGAVSITVYSNALARLGAQRTAALTAAVPCVTALGAVWVLHESPSWLVLTGIALVTSGMLIALFWRAEGQQT